MDAPSAVEAERRQWAITTAGEGQVSARCTLQAKSLATLPCPESPSYHFDAIPATTLGSVYGLVSVLEQRRQDIPLNPTIGLAEAV